MAWERLLERGRHPQSDNADDDPFPNIDDPGLGLNSVA